MGLQLTISYILNTSFSCNGFFIEENGPEGYSDQIVISFSVVSPSRHSAVVQCRGGSGVGFKLHDGLAQGAQMMAK